VFSIDDQELCFVNFITCPESAPFSGKDKEYCVPNPLRLMRVSVPFPGRSAISKCLALVLGVMFSGIIITAAAQTKTNDSQPGDSVAGQTGSGQRAQSQIGSSAAPAQYQGTIHIVPFGRGSAGVKNGAAPAGAHLTYFGGPIISNAHVVVVFWGPSVNTAVTAGIGQFFTDITSSNYYDLLSEYSTAGITSSGGDSSNQSLVRGQFDGANTITPSVSCPGGTCTITDSQIQTELAAQSLPVIFPSR
jgi:hypothetical protein